MNNLGSIVETRWSKYATKLSDQKQETVVKTNGMIANQSCSCCQLPWITLKIKLCVHKSKATREIKQYDNKSELVLDKTYAGEVGNDVKIRQGKTVES